MFLARKEEKKGGSKIIIYLGRRLIMLGEPLWPFI